MSNTTFAVLAVGGAILGSALGYKAVKALPDRFTVFGKTFVRKTN